MGNKKYNNSQKALLVIDIQEDYTGTTAKAPYPYKDSERLITTVNKIIEEASKKNIITVYIRQEFDGFFGRMLSRVVGHRTAIKGKPGTEFDKRINIMSNHCFSKPMPDAFSNPKFEAFLAEQKINELYLVGLDAAGCVYFTAKGALKRGYNVSIIKDGIVLLAENKWGNLLKKFKQDGITLISSNEF
ncbi:cysteine hydrolase [Clostridium sp. OS1-26]|uniref:cysteine hydrolase family protein n=1 Tax=Clostridium sp. OS1-26 TaxID=3070681 RepID=UPI0027DEC176|nr:cysteine hydrolase [Clostridium sp. OS1-26]WML33528.1 cysteine hydrolase [Clostridium sp. OS1-26]